jgi:hypothetical protein
LKSRTTSCVEQLLRCASGFALAPRRPKRSPPQINPALHRTALAALFSLRRIGVSCNLKAPPGPWKRGRAVRPLQAHRAKLRPVCRLLPKVQTKRLSIRPRTIEAAASSGSAGPRYYENRLTADFPTQWGPRRGAQRHVMPKAN